jgi:hypothetical protein
MDKEKVKQLIQLLKKALEQAQSKRNFDKMGMGDKTSALAEELRGQEIATLFYITDVFDNFIVIRTLAPWWDEDEEEALYSIPYVITDGVVSFGSPQKVERVTTYLPITDVNPEPQSVDDQTVETQSEKAPKSFSEGYKALTQCKPVPIPLFEEAGALLKFDPKLLQKAKSGGTDAGLSFQGGVATVFEIFNTQGQYYPKKIWENNLAQLQERAKANMLMGEADHPESPSVERQCIKFESIAIQDNTVVVSGKILPTRLGNDIIVQAVEGVPIALSSRGFGTVKLEEVNGQKTLVVQDDFYCEAFDAVWKPATYSSYITDFEQSQGSKTTPEINQSANEGGKKQMEKLNELIQEFKVLLKLAKERKIDVANEEATLTHVLEQMQVDGVSEDSLMSIMSILGFTMKGKVFPHPEDPNKNSGIFNPVRTSQSEEPAPALTQAQESIQSDVLTVRKLAKDAAVTQVLQNVDTVYKPMFQEEFAKLESAEEVVKAHGQLQQTISRIVGFGGMGFNVPGGIGMLEREARYEKAPKTPVEALNHLLEGVEDKKDAYGNSKQSPDNPRFVLGRILQNMARTNQGAIERYCQWQQGNLLQGAGDLTTSDLVTANAFLFPIVRRAYERIIAPEFVSMQPMSSDTGKIFYLDTYDQDGDDLSATQSATYSDGVTELTGTAKKIKITLTSSSISATSKKLQTELTYEVVQDMMNNFGLDAQEETMSAAAGEIAREWNYTILNDIATASGNAGNVNFGKTAPTGFTQTEWNRFQLFLALQSMSNLVFAARYQHITHILCGTTTSLQLAKLGAEGGFILTDGDQKNQLYSGLNKFGTINKMWQVWTSPYLDTVAPNQLIGLYRGDTWSDTPYVFAPYTMAVTPAVHNAGSFFINQGIMNRAARKVVVPKAITTLTFQNITGTPI